MRTLMLLTFVLLAVPGTALAAPPANDNRAEAEAIPAFPHTLSATTAEATVERLDPQVSRCGSIASTVWYRIDTAPDGLIGVTVKGAAGVAPILRIYRRGGSAIQELDCASAGPGGTASASLDPVRGSNYFVLVGRRPGSADGSFDLHAELFLPPSNDNRTGAQAVALPGSIRGTTFGATGDDAPRGCGLDLGTVWYRVRSAAGRRVVLTVAAAGTLDASFAVVEQRRSQLRTQACGRTGDNGRGRLTYVPRQGGTYFVLVGHLGRSDPGAFTLSGVVAQPAERVARSLPRNGARSTVHPLTDVNDLWQFELRPGVVYNIGLQAGELCPYAELRRGRRVLHKLGCGVRTFTPGPDGGGRYVVEVVAPGFGSAQAYRLRVGVAGEDDLGVGRALPNGVRMRGSLSVATLDTVDHWHFDVERTSDVRLDLSSSSSVASVVRDDGRRVASSGEPLRRQLAPGRYVVSVLGGDGPYSLTLLIREITRTTLRLPGEAVQPGGAVQLRPDVLGAAGGMVELQIDRFDPFTGWYFHRLARVPVGGSLAWMPPAEGRWRVRARFLGTRTASPSRSGYAHLLVKGT